MTLYVVDIAFALRGPEAPWQAQRYIANLGFPCTFHSQDLPGVVGLTVLRALYSPLVASEGSASEGIAYTLSSLGCPLVVTPPTGQL